MARSDKQQAELDYYNARGNNGAADWSNPYQKCAMKGCNNETSLSYCHHCQTQLLKEAGK